jgi:hypothetical protein
MLSLLSYRLERVRPFSLRRELTTILTKMSISTNTSTTITSITTSTRKRLRSKRRPIPLPSQSLQLNSPQLPRLQLLIMLPPLLRASINTSPKMATALPMSITTRMATEAAEVAEAAVVVTVATSPTTSTTESITQTKKDSQSSRMRRIITATILLEDTRTPPEELTAVEEEANTRRAKVSVGTVVDAVADPGLLKNIEIKVRLESPSLNNLLRTTAPRVMLNEQTTLKVVDSLVIAA